MNRSYLPLAFVALLALAACSSTSNSRQRGSGDVITMEEIQAVLGTSRTAYDVVARLQPRWLEKRSTSALPTRPSSTEARVAQDTGDIVVYLNNQRYGGPQALRDLSAEAVAEMRYLGPAEAARFGTGHQHGAILVTTR